MNKIDLEKLKQTLPLPQLLKALGYGDGNQKKLCCPLHDDHSPSFSIFKKEDTGWGWKCFAGCGSGDEIDFLAKLRGLDPEKDFWNIADEYALLAAAAAPQIPTISTSLAPSKAKPVPGRGFDCDSLPKSADAKILGKPKRLVIALTDRQPVQVDITEWPIIAASRPTDEKPKWKLAVRQKGDNYIVYGVRYPADKAKIFRAGEIVNDSNVLAAALLRIGKSINASEEFIQHVIQKLPPVRL